MINTTIKINKCYVHKELFGQKDVLFMVDLDITASDSTDDTLVTTIVKRSAVSNYIDGSPYLEFSELSEQQILEWVYQFTPENIVNEWKQEAEMALDHQILVKSI
jgi:hypothetical protein